MFCFDVCAKWQTYSVLMCKKSVVISQFRFSPSLCLCLFLTSKEGSLDAGANYQGVQQKAKNSCLKKQYTVHGNEYNCVKDCIVTAAHSLNALCRESKHDIIVCVINC